MRLQVRLNRVTEPIRQVQEEMHRLLPQTLLLLLLLTRRPVPFALKLAWMAPISRVNNAHNLNCATLTLHQVPIAVAKLLSVIPV